MAREPRVDSRRLTVDSFGSEAATGYREPGTADREPRTGNREPGTGDREPKPSTGNRHPIPGARIGSRIPDRGVIRGPHRQKRRYRQIALFLPIAHHHILATEAKHWSMRRGQFVALLLRRKLGVVDIRRPVKSPDYEFGDDALSTRRKFTWYADEAIARLFEEDCRQMGIGAQAWIAIELNRWIGRPLGLRRSRDPRTADWGPGVADGAPGTGHRIPQPSSDLRNLVPDAGTGPRTPDPDRGSRIADPGSRSPDPGPRIADPGSRTTNHQPGAVRDSRRKWRNP